MSKFTGELALKFDDENNAVLLEPLVWECDYLGSNIVVTVPAQFFSDGATVPATLRPFIARWGDRSTRAAILHDYLLLSLDLGYPKGGQDTRAKCDWQFYLALKALGIPEWKARILWVGTRVYSFAWKWFGIAIA